VLVEDVVGGGRLDDDDRDVGDDVVRLARDSRLLLGHRPARRLADGSPRGLAQDPRYEGEHITNVASSSVAVS
jgi:hypothetical protein